MNKFTKLQLSNEIRKYKQLLNETKNDYLFYLKKTNNTIKYSRYNQIIMIITIIINILSNKFHFDLSVIFVTILLIISELILDNYIQHSNNIIKEYKKLIRDIILKIYEFNMLNKENK